MKILIVIVFIVMTSMVFAQEKESTESTNNNDPKSVVTLANNFMMNMEYESILSLTEEKEKVMTLEMISNLRASSSLKTKLAKEMKKLEKFEILKEEIYTNEQNILAMVSTKWIVRVENTGKNQVRSLSLDDADKNKTTSNVYTDYLLRVYDGQWKIISQKSR